MEKSSSNKRSRDDRDREHHKHRDSDHHRHHPRDSSSSHREHRSRREDRASSRDREKSYDSRDDDRERSRELRDDREGDRDERSRHRDRSHDEREESVERKPKRKERERGEDEGADGDEKRSRALDGERKQRRRFEDGNGSHGERRERRKFEDKVKEEEFEIADGVKSLRPSSDVRNVVKVKDEVTGNGGVVAENGAACASSTMKSSTDTTLTSIHVLPTKVSSISTTNENKGVSVTRSHEVPGKTSTDGAPPAAGKSGSLSLDVLAKAKKALQIQKELSEKLKKIPLAKKNASSSSGGTSLLVQKEGSVGLSSTSTHPVASGVSSASSALPAGATPAILLSSGDHVASSGVTNIPNYEAVKRAQELAAKMGFRQDPQFAPLINLFPGQVTTEFAMPQKPTKAPVLRLDALGREVDEHGNVVNITKPSNLSTLKVNINKQKKEAFQILKPELDVDPESNPHFDARMGIDKNKLLRPKRMSFQFVEEGKWSKDAEMLKLKSQFGEARAKEQRTKQAQLAKAKAAPDINPNLIEVSERIITKEKPKDEIPEVEWWDVPILQSGTYGEVNGVIDESKLKMEKITIYVEHPRPIEPPAEPAPPPPQPLKLTKKEQKKLRTQRRVAREKEKQEMIRQGVTEPPKPKVKMSNLMRVLGAEATQDPTRLEREIRTAAAEREQAHVDRNIARKLTPAERREKKERKLFDDPTTMETIVSVYKINDLSHKQTRYKVDVNAKENRLTGCAVISEGINVVVVEGGTKSIKRYGKLMLRRINWAAAVKDEDGDEEEDEGDKPLNQCHLVWQGSVAKPSFNRFYVHECMTEAAARKVFADAGVVHYWDIAVNFSSEDQA